MKIAKELLFVAGMSLVCGAAFAAEGTIVGSKVIIWTVAVTGGFGGFVHGITRQTKSRYLLRWPFVKVASELGFVGDILIGIAAGTSIFFVMESFFGLRAQQITQEQPGDYLKFVALGVLCGYAGASLLDGLSFIISKRLIKAEQELETEEQSLSRLKAAVTAESLSSQRLWAARAFGKWRMYEEALELCDEAIALGPNDPDTYIEKSLVYAAKAAENKGDVSLYKAAIDLTDKALEIDASSGRAYYDRACYKQLQKADKQAVLDDLRKALERNEMVARVANKDPDLEGLRDDDDFKHLVHAATEKFDKARGIGIGLPLKWQVALGLRKESSNRE